MLLKHPWLSAGYSNVMDLDSICFLNTPEYSNVMDFAIIVFYCRCCVGLSNAFSEFVNNDIHKTGDISTFIQYTTIRNRVILWTNHIVGCNIRPTLHITCLNEWLGLFFHPFYYSRHHVYHVDAWKYVIKRIMHRK